MSRLQEMRMAASAMPQEPTELLRLAGELSEHGDTISAAAGLARLNEIEFERQAIIRWRVGGMR